MHFAASAGLYSMMEMLMTYGADENIKNNDGLNPWDLCIRE